MAKTWTLESAKQLFDYILNADEALKESELETFQNDLQEALEALDAEDSIDLLTYCLDQCEMNDSIQNLILQCYEQAQN